MRRFGFGIALLVMLLLCSLAIWWGMEGLHRPIVRELTRAAALAEENGPAAKETAMQAKDQWQRNWHFTAAVADHTPMEEIDDLFAELETYAPDSQEFTICCRKLIRRTAAMAQAQGLSWWSLL